MAARYREVVEVGISGRHGAHNVFRRDGESVVRRRALTILAADVAVTTDEFVSRSHATAEGRAPHSGRRPINVFERYETTVSSR
ncbi:MAG: hypothetical protein ACJAYU_001738 [Bradymonadia bacterium]|jgi:hypothetical protein